MNRKSILAGLLCLVMMSGCGSSGTIQSTTAAGESAAESVKQEAESTASSTAAVVNDNRKKPAETNENTAPKPTEISMEDFDIREIRYDNEFATMEYLVIKNNSEKAVEITGNATALSADGSVVGAADCSINVLGPGEESIAYFYFSNVTDVAEVDYSLSYNEAKYYDPVIKDLGLEVNVNDSNVVVLVTNNGSKPAMFVEAYALFYDANNNVVYASSGFVMDSDSEIKPGATLSEQISAYEAFDHVEVYLTGRAER